MGSRPKLAGIAVAAALGGYLLHEILPAFPVEALQFLRWLGDVIADAWVGLSIGLLLGAAAGYRWGRRTGHRHRRRPHAPSS